MGVNYEPRINGTIKHRTIFPYEINKRFRCQVCFLFRLSILVTQIGFCALSDAFQRGNDIFVNDMRETLETSTKFSELASKRPSRSMSMGTSVVLQFGTGGRQQSTFKHPQISSALQPLKYRGLKKAGLQGEHFDPQWELFEPLSNFHNQSNFVKASIPGPRKNYGHGENRLLSLYLLTDRKGTLLQIFDTDFQ